MTHSTLDMRSFFKEAEQAGIARRIDQPVDVATEVPTLCSQTFQPTMFANLKGFDGFSLVDGLTRTRETQKLALGFDCADGEVIAMPKSWAAARAPPSRWMMRPSRK